MHNAAANGSVELAALLLEADACVDDVSSSGESALTLAAKFGQSAMVFFFLAGKADVNLVADGEMERFFGTITLW